MTPRGWRRLMWFGVVAAGLGCAAWSVSLLGLSWYSGVRFPLEKPPLHWNVNITDGLFQFTNRLATDREGWCRLSRGVRLGDLLWWPFKDRPFVHVARSPMGSSTWDVFINVPLWMPAATGLCIASLGYAGFARIRNRVRRGACIACGYDRRGLAADAKCPECGG